MATGTREELMHNQGSQTFISKAKSVDLAGLRVFAFFVNVVFLSHVIVVDSLVSKRYTADGAVTFSWFTVLGPHMSPGILHVGKCFFALYTGDPRIHHCNKAFNVTCNEGESVSLQITLIQLPQPNAFLAYCPWTFRMWSPSAQ